MATPDPAQSPANLLNQIRPARGTGRFLQAWDPKSGMFWFGCGDGEIGVAISSRNWLVIPKQGPFGPSRLKPAVVERLRRGISPAVLGTTLLKKLTEMLEMYLYVVDVRQYVLLAVWVIGTYLYSMFSHYGYLFFHSRFKRCGKTRALEVLHHLAFEASVPLNSPTVPAIRETVTAGRSILLDTIERWKDKSTEAYAAAMELLDAGFRNGAMVVKMEHGSNGNWHPRSFPVFAPYALAAIDRDSLADTALDRSFVIEMERKLITNKKARYSYNDCERTCASLRDDLYEWALQNAEAVWQAYQVPELEMEIDRLEINDRAADIWKPLFAIARVLGVSSEGWNDLVNLAASMGKDEEQADNGQHLAIVRALRQELNERRPPEPSEGEQSISLAPWFCMTSELEAILAKREIKCSELHAVLKQWGLVQKSRRRPGEDGPRRVWALKDTELARIENQLSQL